ncbi:hypothetical protein ATH50_3337 [Haloplanus aerogenes]|uniref:Uncharacterized protein n=1 Tax=Haloplanus aerogenes TaxID=660522 RepID=A0A3M0CPV4_9EURY|nr:hypothetical protein ATH50_3337 [Haloplanus aerogenes]
MSLVTKTLELHLIAPNVHKELFPERFKDVDVGGREEPLHKFQRTPVMSAIGIETNSAMALAFEPIAEDGLADR